nr:hypothetical protein [Pseudomonadota bacterium]
GVDPHELWQRLRLSVELGFAADGMLQEGTSVSADFVLGRVANLLMHDLPETEVPKRHDRRFRARLLMVLPNGIDRN